MLHARFQLLAHRVEFGAGQDIVLVDVGAREQAAEARAPGRRRARRSGAPRVSGRHFVGGDLPVVVGIETIEHLRRIEPLRPGLRLLLALRLDGGQLVLGNEAIVIGVEPREHRRRSRLHFRAR